ncbi:hypothetical protein [Arthrobacter sp. NPDC057013]|uniref:hypothetical protein n=1 Tax=Arthrobacter sp. NPDC057013 TaxID=3345999 RepID=UPI003642283B
MPERRPTPGRIRTQGLISQELVAHGYASNPSNRKKAVPLNAKQFHFGFGNTLEEGESNELFKKWSIPGPGRPLFEDATANNPKSVTSYHDFAGHADSLTLDNR